MRHEPSKPSRIFGICIFLLNIDLYDIQVWDTKQRLLSFPGAWPCGTDSLEPKYYSSKKKYVTNAWTISAFLMTITFIYQLILVIKYKYLIHSFIHTNARLRKASSGYFHLLQKLPALRLLGPVRSLQAPPWARGTSLSCGYYCLFPPPCYPDSPWTTGLEGLGKRKGQTSK